MDMLDYVPDVAELASSRGKSGELITQKVRKGLYALVGISRGCTVKTLVNNLKPQVSLCVQSEVFNLAGLAVSELSGKPISEEVLKSFGVTREEAYADDFLDIGEKPMSELKLKEAKKTNKRITLEQKRYILQKHSEGQSQIDTCRFLDLTHSACNTFLKRVYGSKPGYMLGKKIPKSVMDEYFPTTEVTDPEIIQVVLQAFSKGSSPESIDCTGGFFKGTSQAILARVYGENWRTKSCMLVPKKVCDEYNIPYPELRTTAPELPKESPVGPAPLTNLVKKLASASADKFGEKKEPAKPSQPEPEKNTEQIAEEDNKGVSKAYKVSLLCPTAEGTIELSFVTMAPRKSAAIMKVLETSLELKVTELDNDEVILCK